ncbi:uncharacterized protein LOC142652502 [Rhinoderma darwinii]|uniref:uncharacterized protein LOC142652502 n=1 Tax=Rhinoderma darwinii TaxID=43563 RepID=UPI003F676D1A
MDHVSPLLRHKQERYNKSSNSTDPSGLSDFFEVKEVLDHKRVGENTLYLVDCKGFGPEERSREPGENIDAPALIKKIREDILKKVKKQQAKELCVANSAETICCREKASGQSGPDEDEKEKWQLLLVQAGKPSPRGSSVNDGIDHELCSVVYTSFDKWEEWVRDLGNVSTDQDRLVALLYWLGDAWEAGFSLAKVNRFVSALAFGFKLRGLRDVSKEFLVGQALKGLRRGRVEADRRRPVSFALLGSLGLSLVSVCRSPFEVELFQLAFSLAFFGALRIGELVSPSTKRAGGLRLEEVGLYGDRLELLLRRSKTDQMGKGKRIVLFALPGSAMCPVACMRAFKLRVGSPELPLLRHENGSFLSRYQFGVVFKKCLAAVGVAAGPYSSHSFRIGAATEAGRWGLDDEGVRRIGRWESNRFRTYVRPHLL